MTLSKRVKIIVTVLCVLLVMSVVALAVPLGIFVDREYKSSAKVNSVYEKSYYDLTDSLYNVETKLSKVNVITTATLRQQLLNDVWKDCDVAVNNVSFLSNETEGVENVTKFINQTGDYCYYLSKKLKTEDLSIEENTNVLKIYGIVKNLNQELAQIGDGMIQDGKITADTLSDMSAVMDKVKSFSSIDYPELIYDGPFSDGLDDRQAKFLADKNEISMEEAKGVIESKFSGATDVVSIGESTSSIESYVFTFKVDDVEHTVFISKKGGYVVEMNRYAEIDEPIYTERQCEDVAKAYLDNLGYGSMESVWTYNNNSTVYINFAFVKDGIIYYPDLIKVKVSAQTGEVIGVESMNYLYNHTERKVVQDNSGENKIVVSPNLDVKDTAYCVIPTDWNKEIYCKEIVGIYQGLTYYVYYDLASGEEVRALVVIDNDGNMLI